MRLEALKFLVRREVRIFVVEMHYEADRNEPVVEMVEKRATASAVVERPTKRMLHQTGVMLVRGDLPQLFEAEAKFLRFAAFLQTEALLENLGEAAAGTLGEQRVLCAQLHAAGEAVLVMAVPGDAHVAGDDAGHRTARVEQHLAGGKTRIDFNA